MSFQFPPPPLTVGRQVRADNGILYEWDGVKWIVADWRKPPPDFLPLAGGTMQGPLSLAADPVAPMQAITLQYLLANIGRVIVAATAPPNPGNGQLWWDSIQGVLYVWYVDVDSAQWVAASPPLTGQRGPRGEDVSVSFPFAGKPGAGALMTVPIASAVMIDANLAGSRGFAGIAPSAAATFTLNKISGGAHTVLGTITFAAGAHTATFAGAGGWLAPGDVLQLIAPDPADADLADLGVTIMTTRQ